jgi:type IV pilus assembly protein PilW
MKYHVRRSLTQRSVNLGMSLIELMIAISIGTLIVAAMSLLFASNSRSRSETERTGHNIENGRYAMEVLRGELHHAGYFAEFDPRALPLPATKPDPCLTDLASLQAAMPLHIQGYNTMAAGTLSCLTDVKAGTDAFVTRRAGGCTVANPAAPGCTALGVGAPAFQASLCNNAAELGSGVVANYYRLDTNLANLTLRKRNCPATGSGGSQASTRRYLLRIFYVANNDKAGDGIPTLKYRELGATGFGTPLSVVQGVEQLQIEYGLDTDANGDADVYTSDPDTHLACVAATCVGYWASVVSAKLSVLTRNLDQSPGHVDTNTYTLGTVAVPAFNDGYKRKVFQEVVRLQNPSGRNGS